MNKITEHLLIAKTNIYSHLNSIFKDIEKYFYPGKTFFKKKVDKLIDRLNDTKRWDWNVISVINGNYNDFLRVKEGDLDQWKMPFTKYDIEQFKEQNLGLVPNLKKFDSSNRKWFSKVFRLFKGKQGLNYGIALYYYFEDITGRYERMDRGRHITVAGNFYKPKNKKFKKFILYTRVMGGKADKKLENKYVLNLSYDPLDASNSDKKKVILFMGKHIFDAFEQAYNINL
jgi:hypothetical protein